MNNAPLTIPRISIVTPSYNQSQFLEKTIDSVKNQGYPDLEYIIMDGGSTDGSLDIIKRYASFLTYWESQPDLGQSHAINKGWRRSTGELLAWLNADDVLLPGTLFRVADLWKTDNRFGFISGITERIDHNGNPTGKFFGAEFDITNSLKTSRNTVAQQSTFINRKAVEQVGHLDETLHMSMDWDLWLRIADKFPVAFIPEVWSQMRIWGGTKTATKYAEICDEHIKIIRKYYKNKNGRNARREKRTSIAAAHGWAARLYYDQLDFSNFKKELILSLLICPKLMAGESKELIPKAFPITRLFKRLI